MRFQLIDAGTEEVPLPEPVQGSRGEPERLLRLAEPPCLSATARGPRAAGPCPLGLRARRCAERLAIKSWCLLAWSSGDPHRNGLGDLDHAIEHLTPKRNLALLVHQTS